MNLDISVLKLHIENAYGQEHRIQPIALRAATILSERLEQQCGDGTRLSVSQDTVCAPSLLLDLGRTSDEQGAQAIAAAWLEALAVHLEV